VERVSTDLHIPLSSGLGAPTVYLAILSLAAPFSGVLLDGYSIRQLMIGGTVCTAAGFAALGMVQTFPQYLLVIALLIAVPSQAMGMMGAGKLVARWMTENRGLGMGVAALGVSASGILLPPSAAALLERYGWREIYGVIAVAVFVVLLPLLLAVRKDVPVIGHDARRGFGSIFLNMLNLVRHWSLWLVVVLSAPQLAIWALLGIDLIPMATKSGVAHFAAATLLAFFSIAAALVQPLWGWSLDRFALKRVLGFSLAFQLVGLISLNMTLGHYHAMVGAVALYGIGAGAVLPLLNVLIGRVMGWNNFGSALGAVVVANLPILMGAFYLAGKLLDYTKRYSASLETFAAVLVGVMFVALLLPASSNEPSRPELHGAQ